MFKQPRLMDHFGSEFFGNAKTADGDLWWYEDVQDDGSIKRYPLFPMRIEDGMPNTWQSLLGIGR
jgi:hypothetical protein